MTDTLLVYAPRNFTLIPNMCRRRSKLMVKVTTSRTGRLENTLYEHCMLKNGETEIYENM